MGLNLNLSSLQRPVSPLVSAAPGNNAVVASPGAFPVSSAAPLASGFTGATAQPDMMGILRMMVGLMSELVSMMAGGSSGGSPFSNALGGSSLAGSPTLGADNPAFSGNQGLVNGGGLAGTGLPSGSLGNLLGGNPLGLGGTGSGSVPSLSPTGLPLGNVTSGALGGLDPNAATNPGLLSPQTGVSGLPTGAGLTSSPDANLTGLGQPELSGLTPPGQTNSIIYGTNITGIAPPDPSGTPAGSSASTSNSAVKDDGSHPLNVFTASDYRNFLLAGSQGGTQGTSEGIFSKFADPSSRFASTGNQQFQAAIAGMYANQFKGYALGLDVAYAPGKNINTLANNLVAASNIQMTPEAELLSKVAALYRGDLTGVNLYDNPKLKTLLQQWGRNDIASQPNVGSPNGDVQSIGGVIEALNQQKNPATRQAWLQQIFDFSGNTPSSPSGAVPNLPQYQQAISLVRNGTLDNLLSSYLQTPGT